MALLIAGKMGSGRIADAHGTMICSGSHSLAHYGIGYSAKARLLVCYYRCKALSSS